MRISDWSSDVCSSDLLVIPSFGQDHAVGDNLDLAAIVGREDAPSLAILHVSVDHGGRDASVPKCISNVNGMSDSRTDRKSVVKGKSGSVRVDLGGRRIIKKKKKNQ